MASEVVVGHHTPAAEMTLSFFFAWQHALQRFGAE
jgi:hypothetical protein